MEIPLVGDSFDESNCPLVFELRLSDWVETINPADYGLPQDTPSIDPKAFFVTSGDAVQKARYLVKSIVRVVDQLDISPYRHAVADMLPKAAKLVRALENIKGSNVFLETEYDAERKLRIIPKNPRNKIAED